MTLVLESAEDLDFARWVRPEDGLVWGQASAEPAELTAVLARQAPELGPLTAFVGASHAEEFDPEFAPGIRLLSYSANGRNRVWQAAGRLEVLPVSYSSLPALFRRRVIRADVVMVTVAPAGADGRYPLALADDYLTAALDVARVVIAQVSPHVPRLASSRTLAPEQIDVLVRTDRGPVECRSPESGPTEQALARQVAALIPDGAVLQIGLGAVPAAVLGELGEHNDLGVHSGLLVDGMAELARRGVITNRNKPRDTGVSVAAVALGSDTLFGWLQDNPAVAFREVDYTHDVGVLSSLPAFVAVNTALEVDLSGQVNAEAIDGRYVGGVGGLPDFLRGADRSEGGLPIIALTSVNRGRSRIVETLSGPVTIGRPDVGIVVTEFGAADLRGIGLAERRRQLLAIASPEHRGW